jgi:hypothetical protein
MLKKDQNEISTQEKIKNSEINRDTCLRKNNPSMKMNSYFAFLFSTRKLPFPIFQRLILIFFRMRPPGANVMILKIIYKFFGKKYWLFY